MTPNGLLPSVPIRVIGVIRGRPTSLSDIRDFGEPGAVQLSCRFANPLFRREADTIEFFEGGG
jgi:hypothetical protein